MHDRFGQGIAGGDNDIMMMVMSYCKLIFCVYVTDVVISSVLFDLNHNMTILRSASLPVCLSSYFLISCLSVPICLLNYVIVFVCFHCTHSH